jgi:hypothetical protein
MRTSKTNVHAGNWTIVSNKNCIGVVMLKGEGWCANHTAPHIQSVSLVDSGEQKGVPPNGSRTSAMGWIPTGGGLDQKLVGVETVAPISEIIS